MKLSVIIPVYKAEHTLGRCVESILAQGVEDLEVILIDNDSTDNCPQLCDEWSQKEDSIKVIHLQKNSGPGCARNAGLDISTGTYVTFVDSDDYLMPDTYPFLLDEIQRTNAGILEYAVEIKNQQREPVSVTDRFFDSSTAYWLTTKAWQHAYSWNKIYRRETIGLTRFPAQDICEDLVFLVRLLKKQPAIATSSHGKYVYTDNPNGLSGRTDRKVIFNILKAELYAAWTLKTFPWNQNGSNLFRHLCCRIYDLMYLNRTKH